MATSAVFIVPRLSSFSTPMVECGNDAATHRGNPGSGILGFIDNLPALLGRKAGAPAAIPALCCSSRFPRAAAASATAKPKRAPPILNIDDDDIDDEATEFADMEEWIANKPSGFGLKEYDTSLEDRLLAELNADKDAQAAAKKKARAPPKKSVKAAEKRDDAPPEGVEVYIGNLPKKRNVDRDLRAAFRSTLGLRHIRPIVAPGNEKTREPVCKGLAFLTFASDDDAEDFVGRYNGQTVKFGKTEKKLACELASPHSPFKKQLSQKQGMGSLEKLSVRETSTSDLPPAALTSFLSTGVVADATDSSRADSKLSDQPVALDLDCNEEQEKDVDPLEASEDDLLELEQEIWADLEDEDDFELDHELEDESENSNVDEGGGPISLDDTAQSSQDLGQIDVQASHPKQVHKAEDDILVEDNDAMVDIQRVESGRGFGLTHNSKPTSAAGDKDKRIQELESELKELQLQLKKRNSAELTKVNVKENRLESREERLEALERRVLSKARAAMADTSKLKSAKRISAPKNITSSKLRGHSKQNASQPKSKSLGVPSRLRKKERKIYIEVLSKYSSLPKEVAF